MVKKQKGVSLIETMVALLILSAGLLGAVAMQINISNATQYSRQRMEAVVMAKTELEKLRDTGVCAASAHAPTTPYQGSATYSMVTTCASGIAPSVAVTWTDAKGMEHAVKLDTML